MTDVESHDPLREEFEKLEREVRARELRERQARCPHRDTVHVEYIGEPWRQDICIACGADVARANLFKNSTAAQNGVIVR